MKRIAITLLLPLLLLGGLRMAGAAIPSTTVLFVQNGGSDTANAGLFDPSNANMAADLAATSATASSPVVTSASYTFVAGDVGAWLFVKSGTSWTPGWYQIASVNAGAATLSAGVGAAVGTNYVVNATAGCATVASPTAGTWTIDYSQGTAPIALTGLTSSGAGATILTASATVAMIGNGIQVTAGTNFTTGVYMITNASAGVSLTTDANSTSGAGSAGTAGVGGSFASPGMAGSKHVSGNRIWVKNGSYTLSSSTVNIAGGLVSLTAGTAAADTRLLGFASIPGDAPTGSTRPTLTFGAITNCTGILLGQHSSVSHVMIDCNNVTGGQCFSFAGSGQAYRCKGLNAKNRAFNGAGTNSVVILCEATGGSLAAAFQTCAGYGCVAYANAHNGFAGSAVWTRCISINNTGSNGFGFNQSGGSMECFACTAYGNAQDGFHYTSTNLTQNVAIDCVSSNNATNQFASSSSGYDLAKFINCYGYQGSGTGVSSNFTAFVIGITTLTADPFTSAAGNDFSLNATAGGGAVLRVAGLLGAFPPSISTTGYNDIGAVQHAYGASTVLRKVQGQ